MVIGGLQKFSLADFPGQISAIVFTRGCGFRCPYCHNPELVDPSRFGATIPMTEIDDFLTSRKGRLQGVVVTGGEPTLHEDLPVFLGTLKDMGFAVKLDTNGTNPHMIGRLLSEGLVDFIAMDIKAPPALYELAINASVRIAGILRSIELIRESNLPHEFRTTFVPALHSLADILAIASLVGGSRYVIQALQSGTMLDPALTRMPAKDGASTAEIVTAAALAGLHIVVR